MNPNLTIDNSAIILGATELCTLRELGLSEINTRIDTGAQTSALHAIDIRSSKRSGVPWVSFTLPATDYDGLNEDIQCEHAVHDIRRIKSSNGQSEKRYVISVELTIGEHTWPIELTLSNRSAMTHPMLLGRQAMQGNVFVHPRKTYLLAQ